MQTQVKVGEKRNRTLNQLYILVFKRLKRQGMRHSLGLCNLLYMLFIDSHISEKEYEKLKKHFLSHKPTEFKHVAFFRKNESTTYGFWWEARELEIRRLFINKMINITKPWYIKLYNKFKK
jgi:hypothetical protein